MPRLRNRNRGFPRGRCRPIFVGLVLLNACWAEQVTLRLRNGDQITAEMISLDSNNVTITNKLLGKIVVPVSEITNLQKKSGGPVPIPPPTPAETKAATNQPPVKTVQAPAPAAKPPPVQPPPVKPKPPKHWILDAQLGLDLQYNQTERQLFYGRAKWTYSRNRFRSIVDYLANYGKNDGILSANDMTGSVRVELDVNKDKRLFVFDAAGSGYNQIRKIDLSVDDSFGLGYKLLTRTNLTMSVDFGGNYQKQYFEDGTSRDYGALRLGEQLSWKIVPSGKWFLDEKYEYYQRYTGIGDYRMRFESNLRYLLSNNLNLNFSVIDQYDTQPAPGVTRNDLLLRASLGIKF